MASEGVKPEQVNFSRQLRSFVLSTGRIQEVTRKYPNSTGLDSRFSSIFPFGAQSKSTPSEFPLPLTPRSRRTTINTVVRKQFVASISDFLCSLFPRHSSGRHSYPYCTYFFNAENVTSIAGKANNRVTVTTRLLTRNKWQERKKKKKRKDRRKRKGREGKKREEGRKKERCTGSEQREGRGKGNNEREENTEEKSWWWKGRTREREVQRFKAARPYYGRTILIGADVN